jgi:hypothetical protein
MRIDHRQQDTAHRELSRGSHGRYCIMAPLVLFSAMLLVSGCGDVRLAVGSKPEINALEDVLKIGQSSEADVEAVLGRPSGKGTEMFPIGQEQATAYNYRQKQRTMWTYYYEEGTLFKDDRRILLFVFFDGDRYDGYMWFSSLPDAGSQAGKIGSAGNR